MKKFLEILLSLPLTLFFNFRFLPFKLAVHLPIWVHFRTSVQIKGKMVCLTNKFSSVRFGFHQADASSPSDVSQIVVEKGGTLVFEGSAHIGRGSRFFVKKDAVLTLGDNFAISASSQIVCYKKITFGRDIQFSWDCLVMDSDTHSIFDCDGEWINEPKEIIFGNKIWIGCRATILKGSIVPDNCVVGADSLVSGSKFEPNTIIVGSPAKSVKKIGSWRL